MPIEHRFPSLVGSRFEDSMDIPRPKIQDELKKKLRDSHSLIITGDAGVGKDREGNRTRKEFFSLERCDFSNPSLLVDADIHPKQLLDVDDTTKLSRIVTNIVISACRVSGHFSRDNDPEFLESGRQHEALWQATDWWMELGHRLLIKNVKLLLRFKSFHKVWFHPEYMDQYLDSSGNSGAIAELFSLLAQLHDGARNSTPQLWATPFYSIVQARCVSESVIFNCHATSNWRPAVARIPPFTREEVSKFLSKGWPLQWSSCEQDQIREWVFRKTGGVPQLVHWVALWISDRIDELRFSKIENLSPPIDKHIKYEWNQDLQREINARFGSNSKKQKVATRLLVPFQKAFQEKGDPHLLLKRLENNLEASSQEMQFESVENISDVVQIIDHDIRVSMEVKDSRYISVSFSPIGSKIHNEDLRIDVAEDDRIESIWDSRVLEHLDPKMLGISPESPSANHIDTDPPISEVCSQPLSPVERSESQLEESGELVIFDLDKLAKQILSVMPDGRAVGLSEILSALGRSIRNRRDRSELVEALRLLGQTDSIRRQSVDAGFVSRSVTRFWKVTTKKRQQQ